MVKCPFAQLGVLCVRGIYLIHLKLHEKGEKYPGSEIR